MIHRGCGGEVTWEDITPIDEGNVCAKCGETYIDGEDIDTAAHCDYCGDVHDLGPVGEAGGPFE